MIPFDKRGVRLMPIDRESLAMVRAQLCVTLDHIERDLPRLSVGDLVRRIHALRCDARPYGLGPLDRIAGGCEDAMAQAGSGAMVRAYLGSMREAIGCDCRDAATGDAFLASVAVRLAG